MKQAKQIFKLLVICSIIHLQIHPIDAQGILYYGFFFDASVASSIQSLTDEYLRIMNTQYDSFSTFLESSAASNNVSDPLKYFTKPLDPNTGAFDPYYHVTTKYCGDGIDCSAYAELISTSLDKTFQMELIGLYFTNRTYGIRVKLTADQEKLFDNDSRRTSISTSLNSQMLFSSYLAGSFQTSETYPGLSFTPLEDFTLPPTFNKPHITIGCAPTIPAVTTGTDLLEIIEYEKSIDSSTGSENATITITIDNQDYTDYVIRYGDSDADEDIAFVIYPSMKILANATFQPYFLPSTSSSPPLIIIAQSTTMLTLILSFLLK